jgi:NAD(P)-dependent dehydrogenase (short-subunit alcohol dehydrogenase family)
MEGTFMRKLEGKIAVITGGNSGLGLAAAERFVAEGAYVFIIGRRQAELDAAVKLIGRNVTAVQGDVGKLEDLDRLYTIVREQKGHLDIVFANAGAGSFVPLEQITEEHFDHMFNTDVKGTLFTVQKALPLMAGGGSIVINGSMVSVKGIAGLSTLAASKAALRSFARTWPVELKGRNIRVNVISPGTVITPGYKTQFGFTDEQIEHMRSHTAEIAPLGRAGTPEEIASAVVFLASEDSSYITGIELFVDGGTAQV